jgi:ribosomal protein S21
MSITVVKNKGEGVESLCNRFKRKCKEEKLLFQILQKEFYMKPSEKRRIKQKRRKHNKEI